MIAAYFLPMFPKRLFLRNESDSAISSAVNFERIFSSPVRMESNSSLTDEESGDVEVSTNSVVIQEQSSFVFEGVRFTPKVIEFNDAFEGKQFVQKIKFQNIGRKPANIKICEPSSFVFHMNKHDRAVRLLPSGRCIYRTLTYVCHSDDIVQRSQIRVQINGRTIDYPIIVKIAEPIIEVHPKELDFKVINMGASAKMLKLTILNSGGRGTKFAIDLGRNELDIVVNPPRGTLRAKSHINIFVEMVGIIEGEFYKEMWINSNDRPIRVPIIAEVMRPRLEVYHPNATGDFTLIDFPPTFFGTQRVDTFVLRNFSADMTPFVIFAEIGNELTSCNEARKEQESFKMFKLSAEEGRLEPFEARIVTVVYKPVREKQTNGWHHLKEKEDKENSAGEYLVFFRISRVHCIEKKEIDTNSNKKSSANEERNNLEITKRSSVLQGTISKMTGLTLNYLERPLSKHMEYEPSNVNMPTNLDNKDLVRLCLHGESIEPDLLIQPDTLYFERDVDGNSKKKVLRLTNLSRIEMKFKVHKGCGINIMPRTSWLKPKEAIEVYVSYTSTTCGEVSSSLKIEVFGKSAVLFDDEKSLVSLKKYSLNFFVNAIKPRISHHPALVLGISPILTNEVGTLSDLVTYGSSYRKPYAAVLGALNKKTKPQWMLKERNKYKNVENAVIAFPNDRPRGQYSWPGDKVYRSIFTGFFRYSPPPDLDYTLTPMELQKRTENHRLWRKYMRKLTLYHAIKQSNDKITKELSDYDISCLELFGTRISKKNSIFISEYPKELSCSPNKEKSLPKGVLIPLSPLFLCNIKVEPKFIDFGMVAPSSSVSETLKLHNMNSFPISLRFIPGKSGVTIPDGDSKIVPPLTKKLVRIVFETKEFGRYNGFLDYVINGSHQFKITVSAIVVAKTLVIRDEECSLEFGNHSNSAAFHPRTRSLTLINNLQSPIKFHWELQTDSAYEIEPMSGEVPPMMSLMNQITFNMHAQKSCFSDANLVSESGQIVTIKMSYRNPKACVNFTKNLIDLKQIPLNLVQTLYPVVKNASYYDVTFNVHDWTPMPGVKISPKCGVIKARSSLNLKIEILIPILIRFQFDVKLRIQHGTFVNLKVKGSVVCPSIRITPMELKLRRINAQGFERTSLCAENIGTVAAYIQMDFKEYPEFRILSKKDPYAEFDANGVFLLPGKSVRFDLQFEPDDAARYQFYLPIIINGILGPPMMQDDKTELLPYFLERYEETYQGFGEISYSADQKYRIPCVVIICSVTSRILDFSTMHVWFQEIPHCRNQFQEEDVEITNAHTFPITLSLRTDDINNARTPFSMSIIGNKNVESRSKSCMIHLNVRESIILRFEFKPVKPGNYSVEIPIFIKGHKKGYAYNFLKLTGELKKPKICTDIQEIHFPPVPLNIGTEIIIEVNAKWYSYQDKLLCTVWEVQEYGRLISETIKVLWIEEPIITGKDVVENFHVHVSFQSPYPVSLRTFLVLSDSRGEYCPILITAVADNCSVTTHLFLSTRMNKYKFNKLETVHKEMDEDNPANRIPRNHVTKMKNESYMKKNLDYNKKGKIKPLSTVKSTPHMQAPVLVKIDMGPRLVVQMTKSMTRITQLNFVSTRKTFELKKKEESNAGGSHSISILSHVEDKSLSTNTLALKAAKTNEHINDVTYPFFPTGEDCTFYEKYLTQTLKYVELWVYEVGFCCDNYVSIPSGFQKAGFEDEIITSNEEKRKIKVDDKFDFKKTVIDLVVEFAGHKAREYFPDKSHPRGLTNRAEYLYYTFYCLLHFLHVQGSFLPHVRPENLLCYEDYISFVSGHSMCETLKCGAGFHVINPFRKLSSSIVSSGSKSVDKEDLAQDISLGTLNEAWNKSPMDENFYDDISDNRDQKRNVEIESSLSGVYKNTVTSDFGIREYVFKTEQLDEAAFELRSTQAWLDVILQIFRTLVLPKIIFWKSNPSMLPTDDEDKRSLESNLTISIPEIKPNLKSSSINVELYESNTHTLQERILLQWLNNHYDVQRTVIWADHSKSPKTVPQPRKVDNFQSDLRDSVVLMAVTASYCPYLVPHYFANVFAEPETNEQTFHNAVQLTAAWKEVNLGLSVEASDIIAANMVFMIMVVAHLYETLWTLSPRSYLRCCSTLTKEVTRTIRLENNSNRKVIYEAKFIGDGEGCFRLLNSPTVLLPVNKSTEIKVAFRAKRVHKVSVTLLLCGASVSPNFARNLVFQLEGEPSELNETVCIKLKGTLYQVQCMNVMINPPYEEVTNYEISYSAVSPNEDSSLLWMKPWKEIWNRKVSRRLFINQDELFYNGESAAILNVTIACLTVEPRRFWLLFRGENVGDFIVRIEVISQFKKECGPILMDYPDFWTENIECACIDVERVLRLGSSALSVCPLLTFLKVPCRNSYLWESMFYMFQKTLDSKEKTFWKEHFETNIGIRLIKWLVSEDESEEVKDEFIPCLNTKVTYSLRLDPHAEKFARIIPILQIPDVRSSDAVYLPIHLSSPVPSRLKMTLTMTSENEKEVKIFKYIWQKADRQSVID